MLNQRAGTPSDGRAIEEHADDYIGRIRPLPSQLHREEINSVPGTYHPRIYRPGAVEDNFRDQCCPISNPRAIGQCLSATKLLLSNFSEILETVDLNNENLSAYGHKIRNLLLLSCMEVESIFSAMLRENSYPDRRWNTNDYVKLLDPLYLNKYKVHFKLYPDFEGVAPFEGWDEERPTQSLPWYDAYNSTKHDREVNLDKATLEHAVSSVSAVIALLYAQFGPSHEFWNQGEMSNISIELCHEYQVNDFYIPYSEDKEVKCNWAKHDLEI